MHIFAYAAGVFTIVAAVLDWEWFFTNQRAVFFVKLFGRNGARVFYVLLGVGLLFLAPMLSHQA